ncbi:hypothetical protein [Pseudonocardia xinjiangensis]|uniref:Uncharacterized protein n=1 Tax=Pseudonocardia xinjiangensis TaxID=75289 RepID=A0ABX1RF60_9PSEU|nr:hypothetical protein [Pseudonocardia xinjiangensis]NMH78269.1 hypothetical protein [Pseudonocardia xinjiangensis]
MRAPSGPASVPGISRRRVLAGLLLLPPALAGCSIGAGAGDGPDPLIALAEAARSDAALAAAAVAASPALADRVRPLADARTAHAVALEAEVARADPDRAPVQPTTPPARPASTVTLAQVRAATVASGQAAAGAVLTLPVDRVGLVASVAACCAAYAEVLG